MTTLITVRRWIHDWISDTAKRLNCTKVEVIRLLVAGKTQFIPPKCTEDSPHDHVQLWVGQDIYKELWTIRTSTRQTYNQILKALILKACAPCMDTGYCPCPKQRTKQKTQKPEAECSELRFIVREAITAAIKDIVVQEIRSLFGKDILGFSECNKR